MKLRLVYTVFVLAAVQLTAGSFAAPKPSELSKIMKQMLVFIEKEHEQIEAGRAPLRFPSDIQRLTKAKHTPGKKLSAEHKQYAADFFEELGNYYQANDMAERKAGYNTMVNSCVSCHQHECPGPITVIKKNLL